MKSIVLDSYALISYLNEEVGYNKVSKIFEKCIDADEYALISVVNFGEVYYHALHVEVKIKPNLSSKLLKLYLLI
jgi:PIN domain nuclease of toxin-antitoxin system